MKSTMNSAALLMRRCWPSAMRSAQRWQCGGNKLVRFPAEERSESKTFRCLLNERDVTHLLTVGRNGAGGTVFPAPEGRNVLRLEVFGTTWLRAGFFQDALEVHFDVDPRPSLNRG